MWHFKQKTYEGLNILFVDAVIFIIQSHIKLHFDIWYML